MPRSPRIPSPTGIYHVMMRGVNKQDIFHDVVDFMKMEKILKTLGKPTKKKNGDTKEPICKIFAYCLMTNHIHLLIAEKDDPIGTVIKSLGVAFASYYNKRYERTGPIFEGRFRSEPVEDINYFVNLLHYIHNNPVKAGLVKKPGWYKWSSWREYELPEKAIEQGICEQTIPFKNLSLKQVKEIVLEEKQAEEFVSPIDSRRRFSQTEAEKIVEQLLPENVDLSQVKSLPKEERLSLASKALGHGLSYRQVKSLIDVPHSTIYRGKLKLRRMVE